MTSADFELLIIFLLSGEFAEHPDHNGDESLMGYCRYCGGFVGNHNAPQTHKADCRIWAARNVLRDAQEYLFPPNSTQ